MISSRKEDNNQLASFCSSDPDRLFSFPRGTSPSEVLHTAHKRFFRNGNFSLLLRPEKNVAHDQISMAPFLQRALYGDDIARCYYEAFRHISALHVKPWLREAAETFAKDKLNEKCWETMLDENIYTKLLHEYNQYSAKPKKSVALNDKIKVGDYIDEIFTHKSTLAWLGLVKFSSHWRYNRFIEVAKMRALAKNDFGNYIYGLRTSQFIKRKHQIPNFARTSIFHDGLRADFLRKIGKETSDFLLAGQIIEDVCSTWNLPFNDNHKLEFTKYSWKNPWKLTSYRFVKRLELALMFISAHSDHFRSDKEKSEFLIEAIRCESLNSLLADKAINLSKRKNLNGTALSEFGKNTAMKKFFTAVGKKIETNLPELGINSNDLFYWWRISNQSSSDHLCEILLMPDLHVLKSSLLEWRQTNIDKPNELVISNTDTQLLTEAQTITDELQVISEQEAWQLADEYNGVKTSFSISLEKLSSIAGSDVVNAVMERLTRLQQGHWGDWKPIEGLKGFRELRIHQGQGWRIYVEKLSDSTLLLHDIGSKGDQSRDLTRLRSNRS